jgi:hypothetical protein
MSQSVNHLGDEVGLSCSADLTGIFYSIISMILEVNNDPVEGLTRKNHPLQFARDGNQKII